MSTPIDITIGVENCSDGSPRSTSATGYFPVRIDTRITRHAWGTVDGHAAAPDRQDLGYPACPQCFADHIQDRVKSNEPSS